jgi:F-type H+-transporting ATPase subunit gamma
LFFSKFKSALTQDPDAAADHPGPRPATPDTGGAAVDYEPDEDEILAELLPALPQGPQVFGALLENQASEQGRVDDRDGQRHAQRRRADHKLTIQYNRSRQAAITTELIEIIAGAEAL